MLRAWTAPRCPRCKVHPITAEVLDEDAGTTLGPFCQGCALVTLHAATAQAAQQAREARLHKPDVRGV